MISGGQWFRDEGREVRGVNLRTDGALRIFRAVKLIVKDTSVVNA